MRTRHIRVSGAALTVAIALLACEGRAASPPDRDSDEVAHAARRQFTKKAETQVSQRSQQSCGLALETGGGSFAPDICQLEIISGGQYCEDPKRCPSGYAINLTRSRPVIGEIERVVLFIIGKFETGTYQFDREAGVAEFTGEATDKGSITRHLLRGSVTLNRRGDDQVQVTLDLQFAGGIAVQGSGVIDVKRVNAP